ncbi:MAG TPA: hypothetical protein VFB38_12130 [Chthonomonadaceae bacterium]|nr:hypothetical protein [Chthonomonadaceae bacterium]
MSEEPGQRARAFLQPFGEGWIAEYERAAGLKKLSPLWAKLEIVLGLSAAVCGLKLLPEEGWLGWGSGALIVLGLYLALAGNRSHLYQSMNRQHAYLLQMLEAATSRRDKSP